MGFLTLFSKDTSKQSIKTHDDYEFHHAEGKKGNSKRRLTKDELLEKHKSIGNDLLGVNYAGSSFVSGLD